jgi:glycosyltransferase involved in cell wall biosynthesis
VWIATIARAVRESAADLILVRDIPLAIPALRVARRFRLPVVLDMAENYPAMLHDRLRFTPTGPIGRLIRHPAWARAIERIAVRSVQHILVVIEESRERLIRVGVPAERISIVCNTPRRSLWVDEAVSRRAARAASGVRLVYLGNLDGSRGIDQAIQAVARLAAAGRDVRLTAIGDGACLKHFQGLARRFNVQDQVSLPGRLSFRHVREIMGTSDIGLIPHHATEAWNSTIPNKLFDYMAIGLPVIVSDARPTGRIVREEGCGEVFHDRHPEDLARSIRILEDPDRRSSHGQRGRAAIHRRYNWETDFRTLTGALETVLSEQRRSA